MIVVLSVIKDEEQSVSVGDTSTSCPVGSQWLAAHQLAPQPVITVTETTATSTMGMKFIQSFINKKGCPSVCRHTNNHLQNAFCT